jgi:hypothetical protein
MRNLQILLGLIFIISGRLYAQNSTYQEVVYLKNGGIIRGVIIEQIPSEKLKIETKDGNVFVYTYSEIEKITKERTPSVNYEDNSEISSPLSKSKPAVYKSSGYFNATELIAAFGIGDARTPGYSSFKNNSQFYGIRTSHGYQLSSNLALAIGTGLILGNYDNYFPLFLDFRFPFGRNKIRPSLNLAGGTMLGQIGRFFLNPSFGLKIFLNNRSSFNFNIGSYYRPVDIIKQVSVPYGYGAAYNEFEYMMNDLSISMGFSF